MSEQEARLSLGADGSMDEFRSHLAQSAFKQAGLALIQGDIGAFERALKGPIPLGSPARALALSALACSLPRDKDAKTALLELIDHAQLDPSKAFHTPEGPRTPLQACLSTGRWESATALVRKFYWRANLAPARSALEWLVEGLQSHPPSNADSPRESLDYLVRHFCYEATLDVAQHSRPDQDADYRDLIKRARALAQSPEAASPEPLSNSCALSAAEKRRAALLMPPSLGALAPARRVLANRAPARAEPPPALPESPAAAPAPLAEPLKKPAAAGSSTTKSRLKMAFRG